MLEPLALSETTLQKSDGHIITDSIRCSNGGRRLLGCALAQREVERNDILWKRLGARALLRLWSRQLFIDASVFARFHEEFRTSISFMNLNHA